MKITITEGFAEAVGHAATAIVTRPEPPVLAGMRIAAAGGKVMFAGFDGDTAATAVLDADVPEPGTVIISGRLLEKLAKSLPSGRPVTLATSGTTAVLECGSAGFELVTLDADEYPALPEPAEPAGKVAADLLAQAVARVVIAVAKDDSQPALTAIRMVLSGYPGENAIRLSATDKYRLADATIAWKPQGAVNDIAPLLVPGRHLRDLVRSIPSEQEVEISVAGGSATDPGMVTFSAPARSLTCRLTGGEFPVSWLSKFPEEALPVTAVVDRRELCEAATRVAALTDRQHPHIWMEFTPGQLRLSAEGGMGRGGDVIDADLEGEPVTAAFSPDYLHEHAEAAGTERIALGFTGGRDAVLVTDGVAGSARDTSFRYFVMPVRPKLAGEEQEGESR